MNPSPRTTVLLSAGDVKDFVSDPQKRANAAKEILTTEQYYVDSLKIMIDVSKGFHFVYNKNFRFVNKSFFFFFFGQFLFKVFIYIKIFLVAIIMNYSDLK